MAKLLDVWENLHNSLSRFKVTNVYFWLQAQKMEEIKKEMKRKENETKQKQIEKEKESEPDKRTQSQGSVENLENILELAPT